MKKQTICLVLIMLASAAVAANPSDLAKSSGVKGGIIVHLGCGDPSAGSGQAGTETAKLLLDQKYLVHGLDTDDAKVREARKNIQALGLYGKVSVCKYDGSHLPYTNDLVNLLIDSGGGKVAKAEIMRVLVPGGVAFIGGKKIVKAWPSDIDDWTHFLHGPDNNAVAMDSRVDIPRSIQWVSGPRWGRSHEELASMSAAVTAGGRIYYIVDEAPLASIRYMGNWKLVARDAFNGTLLWKKGIRPWNDHLRHFRSGPTHLPRRLVAVGRKVYVTPGFTSGVLELDGATGETLREYKGTERTEEILVDGGVLYLVVGTSEANRRGGGLHERGEPKPTDFRYVTAINAESGKQLWKTASAKDEYILPLTLAVKGQRVYYQSTFGMVCLDAGSGKEVWKTPRKTPQRRMAFSAPTLVATEDIVLCADKDPGEAESDKPSTGNMEWGVHGWNEGGFSRKGKCTLRAYAAGSGKELWSAPCSEGYNSPVDIFVIDGVVWVGTGFKGYDLKTGTPKGQISTKAPPVGMPHHRCYRDKASERFIFTGKSGVEVLSLKKKGWLSNNSWIRGTCQYGIIPANGLLYAPPDACACFLTVKAPGFFAAAPQRDKSGHMPLADKPVLEKGPAFGKVGKADGPKAGDWPMYRCDAARSGAAGSAIPDAAAEQWSVTVGGPSTASTSSGQAKLRARRLTQPVIAGGKVFVASVDTHTVHALAAADGKELWRFTAGGRVDSSPTVYKGMVLFGSADGWVYCLSAADGALAWRFRAAPKERLVGVYGQLESAWPVHGAVLVQNDTLYVTAGRSSYMDGGIVLYRIDPVTGQELSRTMIYHLNPDTGKQLTSERGFNMEGTTSDILSGDGDAVFLRHFSFDKYAKKTPPTIPHLFAITGVLGEEWFVRSYWVVGTKIAGAGWSGWARTANANPAGRILCFDKSNVYGYGRQTVSGGPTGHKADAYHLFSMSRKAPAAEPKPEPEKKPQPGKKRRRPRRTPAKSKPIWQDTKSLTVRAMVLAGDRLAVAGPVDLGKKTAKLLSFSNEPEALAAFKGEKGIYLRIVSAADGKKLSEYKLSEMPVFDGMAAAGGRLYLATANGKVICLGGK